MTRDKAIVFRPEVRTFSRRELIQWFNCRNGIYRKKYSTECSTWKLISKGHLLYIDKNQVLIGPEVPYHVYSRYFSEKNYLQISSH